ncbi:MAG: hypothetical protein QNK03_03100 [Myxococcota bacterium]|nr:hypothetical protein [Myxococcota bacterium]
MTSPHDGAAAGGLPLRHRAWWLGCATLLALILAGRALHYAVLDLPPGLDRALGAFLAYQALLFFLAFVLVSLFAVAIPVIAAGVLLLLRRRLLRRQGGEWATRPLLHSLVWTALVLGNTAFDLHPLIAGFALASLPLALPGPQRLLRRQPYAGLGLAALLLGSAGWVLHADGLAALLGLALCWLLLLAIARLGAGRIATRDRLWLGLLAVAAGQLAGAWLPNALVLHGGTRLASEMLYDFCDAPRAGRLFAAAPRCPTITEPSACLSGVVLEFERRELRPVASHGFFSPAYYGRLEQLVCLDDAVLIGLNAVRKEDVETRDGAIVFAPADPARFELDVVGSRMGHRLAVDPRRDAVLYVPEWGRDGIARWRRGSGAVERGIETWEDDRLPLLDWLRDSYELGPESLHVGRDSVFLAEWIGGAFVRELDLETLEPRAALPHYNGGSVGATVDELHGRLYVVGLWGVGAWDLAEARWIWKRRIGMLGRIPVIDEKHGLLYVPATVGGRIHVFDRATLEARGTIAIGAGVRLIHLASDPDRLFASSSRAAFWWPTGELARRLGKGGDAP